MKYFIYNIINMLTRILSVVLLVGMFFSCAKDNEQQAEYAGEPVSVHINLSTRANTGGYVPEVETEEMIASYRIVFTTPADRHIVAVVDNTCTPTEKDAFDVRLSPGSYKVYAFANISGTYLDNLGIRDGGTVPAELASLTYAVPNYFSDDHLLAVEDFEGYIPMTGLCPQNVVVTERVSQTFNVEVRRLFAKVQFDFTNATKTAREVRSQSISDLTTNREDGNGSILLMNYDEDRDHITLISPRKATLSHRYTTPLTLAAEGGTASQTFYVLESRANDITNSFMMDFDVVQSGADESVSSLRYALTDPSVLTLIHRNDWIRIPVTIADWLLHIDVLFYPPIGGYPEAEIDEDNSNEFTVTVKSGGDIVINPSVYRYDIPDDKFTFTDTRRVLGTPTVSVTGDIGIFAANKVPRLTSSGEILATLSHSNTGTACITIQMEIITNPGVTPSVTKTLTRKIYIHRTNA